MNIDQAGDEQVPCEIDDAMSIIYATERSITDSLHWTTQRALSQPSTGAPGRVLQR